MAFADQLKKLMAENGCKAVDLARTSGLSEAAISDYLRGEKRAEREAEHCHCKSAACVSGYAVGNGIRPAVGFAAPMPAIGRQTGTGAEAGAHG